MKKAKKYLLMLLIFSFVVSITSPALAVTEEDRPIIVLGEKLSDAQKQEVRDLLEVTAADDVDEYLVTGQDYADYIDGRATANMYSSAMITRKEEGYGIIIKIVTPDHITKVTEDMYANALLTAGIENAMVEVVSPIQVTGESALAGIYKAYDEDGERLDKDRMVVANEELEIATEFADKEGLDSEKISELLAEIKKAISEQDPATKEDVERIVKEQLDKLEIKLSEVDMQRLIDLFEKMRDLDIDFDVVKEQLEDLVSTIKDKAEDLGIDKSFFKKAGEFLLEMIKALGEFFKNIFSSDNDE